MRAIVIGAGPHGRRIIDAASAIDAVHSVEVVDNNPEALADPRLPIAARRHTSLEAAAESGPLGLVCIATNGPTHASLALAAMEAGASHLLVEKPMACSLPECDSIAAAATRTNCVVAVDHPRRTTPVYRWVAERIASGQWGALRAMWVQRPGIGLGCLATHSYDLVRLLSGAEIERVTGWVDPERGANPRGPSFHDPGGLAVLELSDGSRATVAQIEDGAGPMSIEVLTTLSRVRVEERDGSVDVIVKDAAVKKGPDQPARFEQVEIPEALRSKRVLRTEIQWLLEGLIHGHPAATIADGHASVEALVAVHLSHARGNAPVALPLHSDPGRDLWLPVT